MKAAYLTFCALESHLFACICFLCFLLLFMLVKFSCKKNNKSLKLVLITFTIILLVGSKICAKNRSEVCDYVTNTNTFTSPMTGESLKINHQQNCDNIIHSLTCK